MKIKFSFYFLISSLLFLIKCAGLCFIRFPPCLISSLRNLSRQHKPDFRSRCLRPASKKRSALFHFTVLQLLTRRNNQILSRFSSFVFASSFLNVLFILFYFTSFYFILDVNTEPVRSCNIFD